MTKETLTWAVNQLTLRKRIVMARWCKLLAASLKVGFVMGFENTSGFHGTNESGSGTQGFEQMP